MIWLGWASGARGPLIVDRLRITFSGIDFFGVKTTLRQSGCLGSPRLGIDRSIVEKRE
jgi:hypothetical protein